MSSIDNAVRYSMSARDDGDRNYKDAFVDSEAEATRLMVKEAGLMCQQGYQPTEVSATRIHVQDPDTKHGTEFLVREWPGELA